MFPGTTYCFKTQDMDSISQLTIPVQALSWNTNINNINLAQVKLFPHLTAFNCSVLHPGCRGRRRWWGPPLLGLSLGRQPRDTGDRLRLAQGAGPIRSTGEPRYCGHVLWVTWKIKGEGIRLTNRRKKHEKMYKFKTLKNIFVISLKQGTNMITDL